MSWFIINDEKRKFVSHGSDFVFKEYNQKTELDRIPHEWGFIVLLFEKELPNNPGLANIFENFVYKYYRKYKWAFNNWFFLTGGDEYDRLNVEAKFHHQEFMLVFVEHAATLDDIEQSMEFGDIVTDFLIRYCNYSLVDFGGNKIIYTAQSDCDKRFREYLENGYQLHRISKLYYDCGWFYKLPVLPTKDIGIPFEEVIEGSDELYRVVDDVKPFVKTLKNTNK